MLEIAHSWHRMKVSAKIGKQWLQNVAADILDPVEQLVI